VSFRPQQAEDQDAVAGLGEPQAGQVGEQRAVVGDCGTGSRQAASSSVNISAGRWAVVPWIRTPPVPGTTPRRGPGHRPGRRRSLRPRSSRARMHRPLLRRWSHETGRKPLTAVPCSWQATPTRRRRPRITRLLTERPGDKRAGRRCAPASAVVWTAHQKLSDRKLRRIPGCQDSFFPIFWSVHRDLGHGVQLVQRFQRCRHRHLHRLTRPASAPFQARTAVPIRLVGRDDQWESGHAVPVSRRLPTAGIRFSGPLRPLGTSAFLTVSPPTTTTVASDPTGLPRSAHARCDRIGCFFDPGTAVPNRWSALSSTGACRFAATSPPRPAPTSRPRISTMTRQHRGFTHVHPPGLSLTRSPWIEQGPFDLNPRLRTPQLPATCRQGGNRPSSTGRGYVTITTASRRRINRQVQRAVGRLQGR
jgi:hypothetical protein